MTSKTYWRFQYNTGKLSMVVKDDRKMIYDCADTLAKNKKKYPVAVFSCREKR